MAEDQSSKSERITQECRNER